MKDTNRYIALALCLSLTLGAFVYRPPEAKAIAVVDDAVVIGALLTAFSAGCGLIFANNGMTSDEIAQGMTQKWNEFNESAENAASSFAAWLGFEDTSALLGALSFSGSKLVIPRAIARKFAEFTKWLTNSLVSGSVIVSGSCFVDDLVQRLVEMGWLSGVSDYSDYVGFYLSTRLADSTANPPYYLVCLNNVSSVVYVTKTGKVNDVYVDISSYGAGYYVVGTGYSWYGYKDNMEVINGAYVSLGSGGYRFICNDAERISIASESKIPVFTGSKRADTVIPDLAGEKDTPVTISGVGADATTIEELLRQILAQLQTNTLAPTLEVVGTETGGNTGTDEAAKPYLPYIPRIFEKIKELPGTLANIWETIKGLPAAIAEKIGAFFTTLWGWLQSIIDAITALPAAIAEKIKALFVPREGYAAEFVTDITATYQGRMGLLTYPFTVLADFVGTVATLEEQEPVLRWDAVEWQNKTIIAAGEYNLKSAVSSAQMQTVYMIYKTVVSGMLVVAFLHLCYKKLKEVQRN